LICQEHEQPPEFPFFFRATVFANPVNSFSGGNASDFCCAFAKCAGLQVLLGSAFTTKTHDGGLMPELAPSGLMPMPDLSPTGSPKPFVPFLAPSPLAPFFNNSTPKLSGIISLQTSVDLPISKCIS
jgi:hypothetical protein